jgi:hypothetical protein
MSPEESTAKQLVLLGQAIAVTELTEEGRVWVDQLAPPFAVASMRGLPFDVDPAAKHWLVFGQAIAARLAIPEGTVSVVHEEPPSLVEMIEPPELVAQQSEVLGQAIAVRPVMPPGAPWSDHFCPPSVVASISALELASTPTAQQSVWVLPAATHAMAE